MGETSHKSMRAAAMDDVIFSGTNSRPARNSAEVTIFLDNAERKAPAEFNATDVIEITRRIEREAGSAYRINGREARARDVKILFEDAATGARSPALVRQGQIGEIVNAKPEQRRRILEDAAGIAGLHSRRHEAELRLKATEANLGAPQRRAGPAHQPGREPEAAGARGAALQGDLRRHPPPGGAAVPPELGRRAGARRRGGGSPARGAGDARRGHAGRDAGARRGGEARRGHGPAARGGGQARRRREPVAPRAGDLRAGGKRAQPSASASSTPAPSSSAPTSRARRR